jgi:hypothetical protein
MALPHEVPKLSASTVINYDGDFAAKLDAAIARSNGHAIEGSRPRVIEHSASEITKPLPTPLASPLRRRA